MTWRFSLRKGSKGYVPRRPLNSFFRRGYVRTSTNPNGYHRAVDLPTGGITGVVKQTVKKEKIIWKGWFGALGKVIETQVLEGAAKGKFLRRAHCASYTDKPIGSVLPERTAIATVGMTGNTSGPHDHKELGRYSIRRARDPRYDLTSWVQQSFDERRF
jgi:hypothetical protein